MRKLTPARVSYQDDFLISYHFYMMTGPFHILLLILRVHFMLIEYTCDSNRKHYSWATRSSLKVDQYYFTPKWIMVILGLHDTVARFRTGVKFSPGTRTGVNSRQGDSRRHDILWWYHVNKYRAMRGNWNELAPGRKSPRCHVNTPLHVHCM